MSDDSFCCPQCGGTHFGRTSEDYVNCHDEFNLSCHWRGKWSEREIQINEKKREWASHLRQELRNYYKVMSRPKPENNVPQILFPVPFDEVPEATKVLREYIQGLQANIKIAQAILKAIYDSCPHTGAASGYNERDGNWMECQHCGLVT